MGPPGHVPMSSVTTGDWQAILAADVFNGDLSPQQAADLAAKFQVNPQKTQLALSFIRYFKDKNGKYHVEGLNPVMAPVPTDAWMQEYAKAKAKHLRDLHAPKPVPAPQPQPSGPGDRKPPSTATAAPGKDDKDHNHHRLPQQKKLKKFSCTGSVYRRGI